MSKRVTTTRLKGANELGSAKISGGGGGWAAGGEDYKWFK